MGGAEDEKATTREANPRTDRRSGGVWWAGPDIGSPSTHLRYPDCGHAKDDSIFDGPPTTDFSHGLGLHCTLWSSEIPDERTRIEIEPDVNVREVKLTTCHGKPCLVECFLR